MADFTMCNNYACPVRGSCHRYIAIPSGMQSYGCFVWDGKCEYYIPLWSETDTKEIDRENMK
ncbi:MAG: hypothetical protein CMF22_10220 [Idiomarinaceae bacterium]|nr:hypothetical protein [Idiomarinaceae bacterium]MBG23817.1 hypothetical protein [Idiomarinaceae bacterium]|tara:strand:+ start:7743 stop:7928 length:186 start_codon:yes stop_codon:yes gene_type:complete